MSGLMSVGGWVRVFGMVAVSGLVLSCHSKKPGEPGPGVGDDTQTPPAVFSQKKFSPQLVVADQAGQPIGDASVVFGALSVKSKADGSASLPEQTTEQTVVVTVSASGYAPITKTLSIANAYTPLLVTLSDLVPATFDGDVGAVLELGSTRMKFSGHSFLRSDGTPYSGVVKVNAATLFDGTRLMEADSGDGLATGLVGPEPLDLLAAAYVEITAADGAVLKFAAGERAVVSLSLPSQSGRQEGDELSLFNLDGKTGLWSQISGCKVQNVAEPGAASRLACVGEVDGFSSVAIGSWNSTSRFCRRFSLKTTKGFPAEAPLTDWWVRAPGRPFLCQVGRPTSKWPLGTSTVTASVPGRPDKVWIEAVIGSVALPRAREGFLLEVAGAYDGTCPETVLEYNPVTRTIGVDGAPLDRPALVDKDGDGYFAPSGPTSLPGDDCDDNDRNIHPGAQPVLCDGKDHDCDGQPDIARVGASLTALSDEAWNLFCPQTRMMCPGALGPEVPGNGRDEDCDGFVSDADGDGFFLRGDPGFVASGKPADCDDRDPHAHPGGTEVPGNLVDEDCDGVADDQDGDGYPSAKQLALAGKSQTTMEVDCDDLDADIHPGSSVKDVPVLAPFYEGDRRKAEFCTLFVAQGKPTGKLLQLLIKADRNCNGVLEDLDGDGRLVAAAGAFANPPPYDANDLDPRVQDRGPDGLPLEAVLNDSVCKPSLKNFGSTLLQVCPRMFNQDQGCFDTYRDGRGTGEFVCGPTEWSIFSLPPAPFAFGLPYGPCSTTVLPACGAQAQCGGPITFAPWYMQALKKNMPSYDVSNESMTGFCMPKCAMIDVIPP